jgi:hypothetical protein
LEVWAVEEIGSEVWLATSKGAYHVKDGKANHIRISDTNPPVVQIKKLGDHVWLLGPDTDHEPFAYQVDGDTAHRVPNDKLLVRDIRMIGDRVWLVTFVSASDSAYMITAQGFDRILDRNLSIRDIKEIPAGSRQFWLTTSEGLYRVGREDQKLIWKNTTEGDVFGVTDVGGEVWFLTFGAGSAYRVEGDEPKRALEESDGVWNVLSAGGHIWLVTNKHLYRMEGNIPKRVFNENLLVSGVEEIGGEAWLATSKGAYRFVDGEPRPIHIRNPNPPIGQIKQVGQRVWLLGARSETRRLLGPAYQVSGNAAKRIPDEDLNVESIQELSGLVWLITDKGAFRVDGEKAKLVLKRNSQLNITNVSEIDGVVWLTTMTASTFFKGGSGPDYYQLHGDEVRRFPDESQAVRMVGRIGLHLWFTSGTGVYRVEGNTLKQTSTMSARVSQVSAVAGKVWWWTDQGAFRFDEDVSIQVRLRNTDSWWKSFLDTIVPGVWMDGVNSPIIRYVDAKGKDAYEESFPRQFGIIMETDRATFDARVRDGNFEPSDRSQRDLSAGRHEFRVRVRDKWGNTVDQNIDGVAIPGPAILPVLLAIFTFLSLAMVLALAPYWTFCHNLLLNPWVRKYASFGLIPLAMTVVPQVGRHVLKRYRRALLQDGEFREIQRRFVVPAEAFVPNRFSVELNQSRTLLLLGESGIGKTAFFMYLTGCYATANSTVPRGVVPVYIPLGVYQQQDPEEMFHAQLASYGQLTDKELSAWFLRQGGFVIFVDGLNEVRDQSQRDKINTFVRNHRLSNLFCISSQQSYPEFSWVQRLEMSDLSPEKLKDLLAKRLGMDRTDQVLSKFTKTTYETYRIPQDLELAIEFLEQDSDRAFPRTRRELYETILDPMTQSWADSGRPEYPDLLFARAFARLSAQDSFFDQKDDPLPDEIRASLVDKKLIVRRGDRFQFRHDLIRAYLASKHFGTRWREILALPASIDANWRSMLEFVCQDIYDCAPSEAERRSQELKNLVFAILAKNENLAMDLFKWLKRYKPSFCKEWEDEFYRGFGKATSEGSD